VHILCVFMMHDDIEFHRTVTIVELIKVLFTLAYQCIENLTFFNFFFIEIQISFNWTFFLFMQREKCWSSSHYFHWIQRHN
jgi:hypothetical protein